jgi:hypothetical protein
VQVVTVSTWARDFGISTELADDLIRLEVIRKGKGLVIRNGHRMIDPRELARAYPLFRSKPKRH